MSKTISLSGEYGAGHCAIVDDDDFDALSTVRWVLFKCSPTNAENSYVANRTRQGTTFMHRLIMNAQRDERVDRINGNRLDNRKENLRFCSTSENNRNVKVLRKNNRSGYKGVTLARKDGKYVSYIKVNGKTIHIGRFFDIVDAAKAYDSKARELFGEFARTNF